GAKSAKSEPQPKPVDPAKKPGDTQAANGEKAEDAQAGTASEEGREGNELTKEEAKQLLDALKNDERKGPVISEQGRGAQQPDDKKILKDWKSYEERIHNWSLHGRACRVGIRRTITSHCEARAAIDCAR